MGVREEVDHGRLVNTLARCLVSLYLLLTLLPVAALELEFVAASDETLSEPHDIVLSPDAALLYVADNGNNRVVVLDAMSLAMRGTLGEEELAAPHDVVFDTDARLLVADTGNARIAVYVLKGHGGKLVASLRGKIRGPEGVAVHPDGRVFATGAWSHNLVVFDNGKVVAERGGFASPHDVEFGPGGELWLADASNDRMVQLDAQLQITRELKGSPYDFRGPRYMDFDARGRLYVADKYTNRVKIIAPDGELLMVLGEERAGKGPGLFDRPEGVEIHGENVWLSDTYNNRIVRYRMHN